MGGRLRHDLRGGWGNVVVAGCTRRKAPTTIPLPALDLYQGSCLPQLRMRVGDQPDRRRQVFILSAKHGLVPADQALLPYDLPLTHGRACELRPLVMQALMDRFQAGGLPAEILLILEPLYLVPLADLMAIPKRPRLRWVPDGHNWNEASAILDEWGWA